MVCGLAQKIGFLPRGSGMPWSHVFFPVVPLSLWDFLWAYYHFIPASGSCQPSCSLSGCSADVLLGPTTTQEWTGAFLPGISSEVQTCLILHCAQLRVRHNTIIPSTSQKGSSKTQHGIKEGSEAWLQTCFAGPFPHLPHLQGGKERRETTQMGPFGFHRSEVTLLTSSSRHVPWRGKTTAAIAFRVARCRVAQFWPCTLLPGAARGENKPAALHVAPAPRHSGTRRCWTHVLLGKQLSASQN